MPSNNLVITGGNGFVGQWLQEELRQHTDFELTSWDMPEVDITDASTYQSQLEDLQPAWVIHLAALASVGSSWSDPAAFERVNVDGTRTFLEALATASPATRVLIVSTADVYAGSDKPLTEDSDVEPRSPYAKSKYEMEQFVDTAFSDRCIIVRPFPHIGPGQRAGFVTADFASQIAAIEAKKQPPVISVGNLAAIRDFTDVRDVVRAYRLLLEEGEVGQVYNIASGTGASIQDVLDQLLKLSTVKIKVERDPEKQRPSDIPVLIGDATKLQKATGWQPEIGLSQSLKEILEYWRGKL